MSAGRDAWFRREGLTDTVSWVLTDDTSDREWRAHSEPAILSKSRTIRAERARLRGEA